MDYELYSKTIATISSVKNTYQYSKKSPDDNYSEKYYKQDIRAVIKNGKFKGKEIELKNQYASSEVYDIKYKSRDDIFVDNLREKDGILTGVPSGIKRDYIIIISLTLLFSIFLLVGGRDGFLTFISLAINIGAFYGIIILYFKGFNILYLSIPMIVFFTFVLLIFLNGNGKITWTCFLSSITAIVITGLITYLTMYFSSEPDYDFMDFILQPYSPIDARRIFFSETLIACMGGVMDVSIAIIITLKEILDKNPNISNKEIFFSSRNVGDDIIGTMIPVMFFTNIATEIPFFILSLRNSMTLHSIIKHHSFFILARFLTGSIAIVLAVPISLFFTIILLKKGKAIC